MHRPARPTLCLAALSALALACKTEKRVEPAEAIARATPAAPAARPPELPPQPAAPAAEAVHPVDPELEARGHAVMDKLADVFVADAADCDKLATDLKAFAAQNHAVLAQLASAQAQASYQERMTYSRRNAAASAAIATKMQSAMTACAAHPSVLAALQAFPSE